jgi:hypothetical protein
VAGESVGSCAITVSQSEMGSPVPGNSGFIETHADRPTQRGAQQ